MAGGGASKVSLGKCGTHEGGQSQRVTECSPHSAPPCIGEKCRKPSHAMGSLTARSPTGKVVCEEPNSRMHHFVGCLEWEGKKYPLDIGNILLRGCKIRNTNTCYGMVIYAGTAAWGLRSMSYPGWGREAVRMLKPLAGSHRPGLVAACLLP